MIIADAISITDLQNKRGAFMGLIFISFPIPRGNA